jgi:energy-converting hydrogenase Eha subunit E
MGLVRYRGLALGDLVTVIGTVVQTPQGPALEAQLVSGGSRADFIATNNQLTVPLTTLAVFALALLLIMIAAIIIIRNRQSQSHAAA